MAGGVGGCRAIKFRAVNLAETIATDKRGYPHNIFLIS